MLPSEGALSHSASEGSDLVTVQKSPSPHRVSGHVLWLALTLVGSEIRWHAGLLPAAALSTIVVPAVTTRPPATVMPITMS